MAYFRMTLESDDDAALAASATARSDDVLAVGTHPHAELRLPRKRYRRIGQRHVQLTFTSEGLAWRDVHDHCEHTLRPGRHALVVGGYRLVLTLESSDVPFTPVRRRFRVT